MSNISIRYDDDGRITNLSAGERPGGWTVLDRDDFPTGGEARWHGEHPGGRLAWRLFYRPETPDDLPPERFNDEPGPNDWHPQSTDTIGVVFERIEDDDEDL